MSISVSAFADVTITINQTNTDGTAGAETYSAYKIFDVKKTADQADYETTAGGPGTEEGFAYTIDADNTTWLPVLWNTTTNAAQTGQTWVKLTLSAEGDVYTVEWIGENTAKAADDFAKI